MDFLRGLAGTFTSSVFRLAVTAGTLALIYFFLVKPVLDTTEEVSRTVGQPLNQSFQLSQQQLNQAQQQIQQAVQQARAPQQAPGQVQITRTLRGLTPRQSRRLTRCITRANGNIGRINRCFDRFSRKRRR
jgi:hypothetical protein